MSHYSPRQTPSPGQTVLSEIYHAFASCLPTIAYATVCFHRHRTILAETTTEMQWATPCK